MTVALVILIICMFAAILHQLGQQPNFGPSVPIEAMPKPIRYIMYTYAVILSVGYIGLTFGGVYFIYWMVSSIVG